MNAVHQAVQRAAAQHHTVTKHHGILSAYESPDSVAVESQFEVGLFFLQPRPQDRGAAPRPPAPRRRPGRALPRRPRHPVG